MTLRVTQQSTIRTTLWALAIKQTDLARTQEQMSTLRRINRPSDDPAGSARLLSLRSQTEQIDRFSRNIVTLRDRLDSSASTLQQVGDLVVQAKQIVLSAANSTVDQSQRAVMAGQVENILRSIVQLANTEHAGRFLFSGTATQTKPFELGDVDDAAPVSYRGNDQTGQQYVDFNTKVNTNLPGSSVFHVGESGDLFALLSRVRRLLLNTDALPEDQQVQQLSAVVDDLTHAHEGVIGAEASLGSQSAALEDTSSRLADSKLVLEQFISEIQDADITELIVRFNDQQNALQAALIAARDIISPTLLDALK